MKVAVYTANFGDYDNYVPDMVINPDYDYFYFTDNESFDNHVYSVIHCANPYDNTYMARSYKILKGYLYLSNIGYDVIVWHDASMNIVGNINDLIDDMLTNVMVMSHDRNCIYKEYEACCCTVPPKDNISVMHEQVQKYADEGYPQENGMVSTGVLIRRVSDDAEKLSKMWMEEVSNGSIRDQLSFNYVTWKHNIRFDIMPFQYTIVNYFNLRHHKR